jgi:hypothetical protein
MKNPDTATQIPTPDIVPTAVRATWSEKRSLGARQKRDQEFLKRKLEYFLDNVTTIKVPFALDEMKEDMYKESLESICDNELAQKSPQCFSAKFVDKDDLPILFYFGWRNTEQNEVGLILNSNSIIRFTKYI